MHTKIKMYFYESDSSALQRRVRLERFKGMKMDGPKGLKVDGPKGLKVDGPETRK